MSDSISVTGNTSPHPRNPNAPSTRSPIARSLNNALVHTTGLDVRRFFSAALRSNSQRILEARLSYSSHRSLLEQENTVQHYGDVPVLDEGIRNVLLSFIAARIAFIEECLGKDDINRCSFVDVGDSSGIFLRALGKTGWSINSAEIPAENIRGKGIGVLRCDASSIALKGGGCDYALCFETLEHLPSPFDALMELYRVCREGAFVSVPYVNRTTVYPRKYADAPQELLHIFELSKEHWNSLLSHTPFKVQEVRVVPVLDSGRGIHEKLAFTIWKLLFGDDTFSGTFKSFLLYHLVKPSGKRNG